MMQEQLEYMEELEMPRWAYTGWEWTSREMTKNKMKNKLREFSRD